MLAVVSSGALQGIKAAPVQVEVNTGESGDPRLVLVGLPDAAVKESNDRVASALANSGFAAPQTRTTVNLAPGDIRKEGPIYDLPIALGILASSRQIKAKELGDYLVCGELGLSGEARPVKGALAMGMLAKELGKAGAILPPQSAEEAALVDGLPVYKVDSLDQAAAFLEGSIHLKRVPSPLETLKAEAAQSEVDFAEVKGQGQLRRAVEVAVSGGHNLLVIGPPGSGKSMIAKRIPTIMPEPTLSEYLEILRVQSAAGQTIGGQSLRPFQRPFRAPHHTISDVGLLGGGSSPSPGEISLAHNGALFLDELPEFKRSALEVMRQPLEDGEVAISRSAAKAVFPASFMLIAAMNPCPCGFMGDPKRECRCSAQQIQRYRSRVSGPLLDRIDIHVEAPSLALEELRSDTPGEASAPIRERVRQARRRQLERFGETKTASNARMSHKQIRSVCQITPELSGLLQQAMDQLNLSARAYDRILKVSRTIADMAESEAIEAPHLLEAIQYRSLDRALFY